MRRDFIYNGGLSTRYHTVDVINRQNIAEHSFGVAWFCEMITEGNASKNLIMAALAHDLAEHVVGDIPSPAKRALGLGKMFGEFEETQLCIGGVAHYAALLIPIEITILKLADMMDGMMFCLRERSLGNRKVAVVFNNFRNYTDELLAKNPAPDIVTEACRLRDDIVQEWEELTNDGYSDRRGECQTGSGRPLSVSISTLGLDGGREHAVSAGGVNEIFDALEKKERGSGS